SPPKGVEELMEKLMANNPAHVLETVASTPEGVMPEESAFSKLCKKWAGKDITGFTEWVNQQSEAEIRDPAVSVMIYQLIQRQQFPEAVEWAMSSEKGSQEMFGLLGHWANSRPDEAKAWVETADISPAQKERYKKIIGHYNNPESR
ncbi:MAG: hypothetical protein MUF13_10950, partial [Akkermansiaceae bacterium]|nr:hypothetical protein [Akkermansiaceae bacterium]